MKHYNFVPYDPAYPKLFAQEKRRIQEVLENKVIVEHFGSSAVKDLGGKGFIDIYLLVPKTNLSEASNKLQAKLGYQLEPSAGEKLAAG